jgi:hypothetical protein
MNAMRILAMLVLVGGVSRSASAQTSHLITFQIDAINQIGFAGAPSLVINTATAGSDPNSVSAAASWSVTTNQTGSKITASIGTNMPAGLTLSTNLTAPSGAASAGAKTLSTVAVDLVTGITKVAAGPLAVTYALTATAAAGVVASTSRTVTYTITGGT